MAEPISFESAQQKRDEQRQQLDEALRQIGGASVGSIEMVRALRRLNIADHFIGRALCLHGMALLGSATVRKEISALMVDAEAIERTLDTESSE